MKVESSGKGKSQHVSFWLVLKESVFIFHFQMTFSERAESENDSLENFSLHEKSRF